MSIKKVVAFGATLAMGIVLAGCGKNLSIDDHNGANGFYESVVGKSSESVVYWRTDADGTNKAKVKSGKFSFDVPSKVHNFTVDVSNDKDMTDTKTIDVKKKRAIATYSDFWEVYNNIDEDSVNIMPYSPNINKNYAKNKTDNSLSINVDDGKLLGLNVYATNDSEWFTSMVGLIGGSLSADDTTISSAIKTAAKKPDEFITKQSGSVKYTFLINTKKGIYQMIVHS